MDENVAEMRRGRPLRHTAAANNSTIRDDAEEIIKEMEVGEKKQAYNAKTKDKISSGYRSEAKIESKDPKEAFSIFRQYNEEEAEKILDEAKLDEGEEKEVWETKEDDEMQWRAERIVAKTAIALVTRPCDKTEKKSEKALEARKKEVEKQREYGAWAEMPVEAETAVAEEPEATICDMFMLDSIKKRRT